MGIIKDFCKKHETNIRKLPDITGISQPTLYRIDKQPLMNVNKDTAIKLYKMTKFHFDDGLKLPGFDYNNL